jgi:hypothetical protein
VLPPPDQLPEAHRIVGSLLGGLPAGSYLALADSIISGPAHRQAGEQYAQTGAVPYQLRILFIDPTRNRVWRVFGIPRSRSARP